MFYQETHVFPSGGNSNYRIPSLVVTNSGTVLAFCTDRIRKIDTIKKSHASGNEIRSCQYDCSCDDRFSAHFVCSTVFSFIYMKAEFKIEENDYDKIVEILKREGVKIY